MSRRVSVPRWWQLVVLAVLMVSGLGESVAQAGPGRPDPRQMSGMPRPDPQIETGTITVRVLDGSFDAPVLGVPVTLELRSADGRRAEVRTMETGNQGRVYFREVSDYAGGQAVARVVVGEQRLRSQQIDILPTMGTAVMLVKGAPERGGTQDISLPGVVFDFPRAGAGSLMVGTFDLSTGGGMAGVDVDLVLVTPDGNEETRTQKTAERGQTTFEGLDELPAGTAAFVRAQLEAEGEPHTSMTFVPRGDIGQALVLAKGRMPAAGKSPHGDGGPEQPPAAGQANPHAGAQRPPLPAPRVAPQLPLGSVKVMVVDGQDKPVANHPITIVKKDFAGTEKRFSLTTDAQGFAQADKLPVVNDALYYVGVVYEGGPYTSAFFGLDKRGGVAVAMRVWPVTSDLSVAKSAVQFEIIEGENDAAQVIQVYEVLVSGDKAFWPGEEPMRIEGLPGAKGFVVLRGAEDWLEHEEKAPFATLAHPIVPGQVAALSVGYIINGHGGALDIEWVPPFTLLESAVVLSDELTLDAAGAKVSEREFPPRPGLDYTPIAYALGQTGTGPVKLGITGLRQTDKRFGYVGIAVGGVMLVVLMAGLLTAPRKGPLGRLVARREALLASLQTTTDDKQRQRLIAALDRVYRKIDALESVEATRAAPR